MAPKPPRQMSIGKRAALMIGVLAGVVLVFSLVAFIFLKPKLEAMKVSAIRAEAKTILSHAGTVLQFYKIDHGSYDGVSIAELDLPDNHNALYILTIEGGETDKILLTATAAPGALMPCSGEDVWTLEVDGAIVNTVDGMAACE